MKIAGLILLGCSLWAGIVRMIKFHSPADVMFNLVLIGVGVYTSIIVMSMRKEVNNDSDRD